MAKKNFEDEIGNLGGLEESLEENANNTQKESTKESSIGGKLRYSPGQQKELDDKEQKDLESFLARSRRHIDEVVPVSVSQGWIPIDREELGIRSRFYPEDWQFFVRPATVEAIKNWSSIDEERIDVVNTVFNDIVRTCVKIQDTAGNIPWSRINSWDRFWFILKVREYTFNQGEAKIEFTDNCAECDQELLYTLTSNSLFYEFPDNEIVDKYWNSIDRTWYIDPREYDVDRPAVRLYVPTLEKDQAILDWAIEQSRANKKLDQTFLRFLPWMLSKAPKNPDLLSKFIKECESIYKSWDETMFDFMDEVIYNITVNPSEKLKQVCPHCGEEVVSSVRFPNGVKVLFKREISRKKFGSRER